MKKTKLNRPATHRSIKAVSNGDLARATGAETKPPPENKNGVFNEILKLLDALTSI